jgi:tetratricopeptide (TPR) repeat protein
MPVAPNSNLIPRRAANSKIPLKSLRTLRAAVLAPLLALTCLHAAAQDAAPQFDDVAARAAAARDAGNLPLAIQLYTQAEQLKPDWPEGLFYLGMLQYSNNDFPESIAAFNHLLQLQPGAPPALALRGLSEFETGAFDDSLRDLDQAVQKGAANQPRNEQIIRYHYAQLLARAGRFQDAILQYWFFATHHIDDSDLRLGLGVAGMRNQTLPKDIPVADRPIYEAAGSAGYVFLSGDSQAADALFTQLFAQNPTTPNLHYFYGVLLFPHAPNLAVDQFQAEVAVAPNSIAAHSILAYSLMIDGRYPQAAAEAQIAINAAPDMEMAKIALGRSLAETGDTTRAADLLTQILKDDPKNLEAHLGMAVVYSRTGNREEAYRERMVCLDLQK